MYQKRRLRHDVMQIEILIFCSFIPIPHSHEGCQCADEFHGDHCEYIKDMPISSLAPVEYTNKIKGWHISLFAVAGIGILLAVIKIVQRSERSSVTGQLEQSWKEKEDRFRTFYSEKLGVRDSSRVVGGDDDGDDNEQDNESDLVMVEEDSIDLQSDQVGVHGSAESISIKAETEPEIV